MSGPVILGAPRSNEEDYDCRSCDRRENETNDAATPATVDRRDLARYRRIGEPPRHRRNGAAAASARREMLCRSVPSVDLYGAVNDGRNGLFVEAIRSGRTWLGRGCTQERWHVFW